ncbi:hypothetical protein AC579_9520 [Pseudocercospora musae]|uniref:Epoxide hydrolase N-terminal domain-containing protein n=1 Tax=Pseudocercospora musae TaxID=113226 RepID=A0A139IN55_9PEZI|nr:hypothetical protein AC579_9520 [Pseudocercospora musae]
MPPQSEEILPFNPHIDIREVERLHTKLRDVRIPTSDILPDTGNDYGIATKWAKYLYEYWLHKFSWSAAEARISQFNHFTTEIEELNVHFIHQKSTSSSAIPILTIHGWPGSFYEFSEVIRPLNQSGFDCIVPSLPGFCWSSPPKRKGWTVKDTARVFDTLMRRLGYEKYCVQAGDWGAMVARELGAQFSERCSVMHLNWCPGALPGGAEMTERERKCKEKGEIWRSEHVGYAVLMRTRPQSLGWMVEDSPVGLMTFIGEKYHEASNPTTHYSPHWLDHILATVSLYYFTRCIATSALIYYENPRHDQFASYCIAEENRIKCPFGYTSMRFDTAPNSERAVESTGNLVWYKERDEAGHFACLEDPKGMIEDVKDVVGKYWA